MAEGFILLRGTPDGTIYLACADQPDDADTWTENRDEAERFVDRSVAEVVRAEIVARTGFSVAVLLDRVGPGPDRPAAHGEVEPGWCPSGWGGSAAAVAMGGREVVPGKSQGPSPMVPIRG